MAAMTPMWTIPCALMLSACVQAPEVESEAHLLLVSQAGSTTVAVIDPSTERVLSRIEVGQLPHRIVRTRAGDKAYVVLVGSQAIAELDTQRLRVTRTFLTAELPDNAGHDREQASEHVSCFDCHRPGGQKPFVVGERPVGIALSEDESLLYVSHIRGARISVIDLASGQLERSVSLQPSTAAVEAADLVRLGESLVIALRPTQPSTEPGAVRFLDVHSLSEQAEYGVGSDPASLLPLPERDSVLVSNFDSDHLSELGLAREPARFTVAPGPLGALALDAGRVLSLDYYSNRASLLDLQSSDVSALPLEHAGRGYVNPTHAAASPDGERWYVVSSGTDAHLLIMDARQRALRAAIPIDGLSFDVVVIPRLMAATIQETAR